MSRKKKNYPMLVDAEETAPDGTVAEPAEATPAPKKKKGVSRFFGFLTVVACVAIVLFLQFTAFKADWTTENKSFLDTVKSLFSKDNANEKLFGFLPALYVGKGAEVTIANLLPYVFALFLVVATLFALIGGLSCGKRCSVKTALVFVMLAGIAQIGGTYFVSSKLAPKAVFDIQAIIVAAVALLLLIVVCIATRNKKVKEEPVVDAEPVAEPEPVDPYADFQTEEVIEAYAYEGGPVAGIEIAEEVYPTLAAIEAEKDPDGAARNTVASLLGNGFDPFLITLNEKEKSEFIDLYVLKCAGPMPEIPGYVVGGDNKDFFNKVFIYLGQYRDKIPADLLAKMYAFAMKI